MQEEPVSFYIFAPISLRRHPTRIGKWNPRKKENENGRKGFQFFFLLCYPINQSTPQKQRKKIGSDYNNNNNDI
jgi:hypothetical protein